MFSALWRQILHFAAVAPARVAVEDDDGSWTYAELAVRVRGAAQWLSDRGVRAGDVVALDAEPDRAWWAATLAVWRVGGVYLPLDPDQPSAYRAELVADAGPVLVLDAAALKALSAADDADDRPILDDTEDPVALIYTSGSTGRPKGVVLHGRALAHLLSETRRICPLAPDARVLQHLSPAFDASLKELMLAFGNGAVLTVRRSAHGGLRESLVTADAAILTPSLLRVLDPADLANLKLLVCGGEALHWSDLASVADQTFVLNAYGPTECTIFSTYYAVGRRRGGDGPVPIGVPLVGVQAEVDEGELILAGPTVALGYRGGQEFHGRYRTGDRVRMADGQLVYLGRIGTQVKVRGFRVELGDVEHRLRALPGVRDAAACTADDGRGGVALCAAVIADDGSDVAGRARRELPTHLVPTRFERVASLPRMVSGKTDRAAVAALFARPAAPVEVSGPAAPMCALVSEVLGTPVGPDDDFFAAGGDSLAALRLQSLIEQRMGVALPLDDINDAPTIADLAARAAA